MSLVELGWRRFNFFDRQLVSDPNDPQQPFLGLQELECAGWAHCNGYLYAAETAGGVCTLDQRCNLGEYWRAHGHRLAALHCAPAPQLQSGLPAPAARANVIVTAGEEDADQLQSQIKLWRIGLLDSDTKPLLVRTVKSALVPVPDPVRDCPQGSGRRARVSCLALHHSLAHLAVAYDDATLVCYSSSAGDLTKDTKPRAVVLRDAGASSQQALLPLGEPVSVALHLLPDTRLLVYLATRSKILAYIVRERALERTVELSARGAEPRCALMAGPAMNNQFIVARRDLVHFYDWSQVAETEGVADGRCVALEADRTKKLACALGPHLLLVSHHQPPIEGVEQKMDMLTIYDIAGQYVAYAAPLPQVCEVFCAWGEFLVLCRNGKLFRIVERALPDKLDVLFRKNLYDVALGLAQRRNCPPATMGAIYSAHADYLYGKGDYGNAARQYAHTLGHLQPSYVIRKLLDAQRIEELVLYLCALHATGLARPQHTTILLNCYTKLGERGKIERFLDDANDMHGLDVDTAIKVLRSGDFRWGALVLAQRHQRHDAALRIMLEGHVDSAAAACAPAEHTDDPAEYISRLPFLQAVHYAKKYGVLLMERSPEKMLGVLTDLCTGRQGGGDDGSHPDAGAAGAPMRADVDDFVHILAQRPDDLRQLLEACAQSGGADSEGGGGLLLLELYLQQWAAQPSGADKDKAAQRILDHLKGRSHSCHTARAVALCDMHGFAQGVLLLYRQANRPVELLRRLVQQGEYAQAVLCCRQFGSDKSSASAQLWLEALSLFAQQQLAPPPDCVQELLEYIDDNNIIPPLKAMEILARSQTITLCVVKEYLLRWLKREKNEVDKCEQETRLHREEIESTEKLIHDLKTKPLIIRTSKCAACDTALEPPTQHFACLHAYHMHCYESYSADGTECPACAPRLQVQSPAGRGHAGAAPAQIQAYHMLTNEIASSADCMSAVAKQIGLGLLMDDEHEQPPDNKSAVAPPQERAKQQGRTGAPGSSSPSTGARRVARPKAQPGNPFEQGPALGNPFEEAESPHSTPYNPFEQE